MHSTNNNDNSNSIVLLYQKIPSIYYTYILYIVYTYYIHIIYISTSSPLPSPYPYLFPFSLFPSLVLCAHHICMHICVHLYTYVSCYCYIGNVLFLHHNQMSITINRLPRVTHLHSSALLLLCSTVLV